MQIAIQEVNEDDACDVNEQRRRAWNDILKNATQGMMSWAERNFKQKSIEILYEMGYYKFNQTIYLNSPKEK